MRLVKGISERFYGYIVIFCSMKFSWWSADMKETVEV